MTSYIPPLASPLRPRAAITFLVGIAGLAFSLTILWLAMRAVVGIGGACASGGPYVPAVECPDAVIALTPLSIFGLFIFGGLAVWGGALLGGPWLGLIFLAWPARFLPLGWNFLEFGIRPLAASRARSCGAGSSAVSCSCSWAAPRCSACSGAFARHRGPAPTPAGAS